MCWEPIKPTITGMIVVIGALLHGQHSQVSLLLLLVLYHVPAPDSDVDGIITHVKCEHPTKPTGLEVEIGRPKLDQARGMYFLVSPIFDPVRTRSDGSTRHAMGRVCRETPRSLPVASVSVSVPYPHKKSTMRLGCTGALPLDAMRPGCREKPPARPVSFAAMAYISGTDACLLSPVLDPALLPDLPLNALPINYGRNAILGRRLRQIKVWLAGAAGIRESKIMCWPFFVGAQGPVCFWAWRDENKTKGGVMKRENR
ncbi:hypothetical protein QBC37DRAFT_396023 [Rhypophila decipiens]|uniref:Uncharacterized protein n=1 Tax=Rhypophila decipiens TaxID=261697 RepID=A0AAN6YKT6_9PEZI|nr:hypothetical protein QBC37DRAFT_396023 [Rhypophila decipiens]